MRAPYSLHRELGIIMDRSSTSLNKNCCTDNSHSKHGFECEKKHSRSVGLTSVLFRFIGWFVGFAGLYAMGAVCPFCGRQGCPVGSASAGFIGLLFASMMQWGKKLRICSQICSENKNTPLLFVLKKGIRSIKYLNVR